MAGLFGAVVAGVVAGVSLKTFPSVELWISPFGRIDVLPLDRIGSLLFSSFESLSSNIRAPSVFIAEKCPMIAVLAMPEVWLLRFDDSGFV